MKRYLVCAGQINQKKNEVGKGIFEIAKLCVEADSDAKSEKEKEDLFANLDISESDFSKYLAVGKNEFLSNYLTSVPLHLSILYPLARLDEDAFKAGLAEGIIHAKATRRTVEAWIAHREGKAKTANDNQRIYRVVVPDDFTEEDEEILENDMREWLARRHCRLGGVDADTGAAAQKARGDFIRAAALAVQKREKGRREQEQRSKPKAKRTKAWPFTADQLKLTSKSTTEDCQRMLELIGCGDDFAKISTEADRVLGPQAKPQSSPAQKSRAKKKAA